MVCVRAAHEETPQHHTKQRHATPRHSLPSAMPLVHEHLSQHHSLGPNSPLPRMPRCLPHRLLLLRALMELDTLAPEEATAPPEPALPPPCFRLFSISWDPRSHTKV
jgi:hypothetical protein